MSAALSPIRSRSIFDQLQPLAIASFGVSKESKIVDDRLGRMRKLLSEPVANLTRVVDVGTPGSKEQKLQRKLAVLKQISARVAMHIDSSWRSVLFQTLDRLLDPADWQDDCAMPSEQSFSTFLRMIIYLHPTRRPGLGLSPSGHFLAAWRRGDDRIVLECLANDEVRWVLSRTLDGNRESAAGRVQIHRIPDVTEPYEPEPLFQNGEKVIA